MTQKENELLLRALCAMLPYGVKCHFKYGTSEGDIILKCIDGNIARFDYGWYGKFHVIIDPQYIKPYLRPMWSMTNEEQKEFVGFHCVNLCPIIMDEMLTLENETKMFDWLNAHHFDYRGLIERGLALEAPEGMYKN